VASDARILGGVVVIMSLSLIMERGPQQWNMEQWGRERVTAVTFQEFYVYDPEMGSRSFLCPIPVYHCHWHEAQV
jgi:hypothetical protein